MDRKKLIKKYIDFFKSKSHKEIPNSSLIPENDPTVLFTTAGMHPLVPYLLSQPHPSGKRLCGVQRCIRTGDIEEVGDAYHHTFFEMLGNWSLNDYWKEEAIGLSFEFLTKVLKIKKEKIKVTCFKGDDDAPKDNETEKIWNGLGISKIRFLGKKDNWWGPAGKTGPCGPDTEIFVNDVEIWNNVFMQYSKDERVILVDGMHCLYDEKFNPNKELLDIINNFNTHNILTVNGFREKGLNLVRDYEPTRDTNWEAFSLEEKGIEKDNPEYFKILLKNFKLKPEEVMYFDHDKKNVETANKLGILSKHYTDIKSIKKFIEDNLYAFIPLSQKNVDTGMGVERTLAILNKKPSVYETESFEKIIKEIEKLSKKEYGKNKGETRAIRIIADHVKASCFILADGVSPSNTEQGYVLRRLIRRAVRYGKELSLNNFITKIAEPVFDIYPDYQHLQKSKNKILEELGKEEEKFEKVLQEGLKIAEKIFKDKIPIKKEKFIKLMQLEGKKEILKETFVKKKAGKDYSIKEVNLSKKEIDNATITGKESFLLYQSFGFPIEMIVELVREKSLFVDGESFQSEFGQHQTISGLAMVRIFKSGLADNSEATTKLHTATHLLNEALRQVLKDKNIIQKGSNITAERLRFDFNFDRKLTEEEIKKVEELVNEKINEALEVKREEMSVEEAKKKGAQGIFESKYGEKVSVYSIGDFSKEICAGPHVKNTRELGKFKIIKEESSAAGIRRIKAVLEG